MLLERVRSGEWRPSQDWMAGLSARYELPPGLALIAQAQNEVIVVRPNRPLSRRRPSSPMRQTGLFEDQQAVARLAAQGLTIKEISARLGKKRRWVLYRLAGARRSCGARRKTGLARHAAGAGH